MDTQFTQPVSAESPATPDEVIAEEQLPALSDDDLMPFYLLAMAGAY